MRRLLIISMLIGSLTLIGCESKDGKYATGKERDGVVYSPYKELIKDKLYYIPHEIGQPDLAVRYKEFINDHNDLNIISVTGDPRDQSQNSLEGYFIFTEKKE